jgi:hypothetical protein
VPYVPTAQNDRDKYKGLYENAAAAQVAAQSKLGELSDQLEGEKKNSSKALAQIELLNQQIGALRQQGRHWRLRSTSPRRRITTLMNVLPNSASKQARRRELGSKGSPSRKGKNLQTGPQAIAGKPTSFSKAICFSFVVDEVADNAGKPFT